MTRHVATRGERWLSPYSMLRPAWAVAFALALASLGQLNGSAFAQEAPVAEDDAQATEEAELLMQPSGQAQEPSVKPTQKLGPSGLPLPRFVSLKSGRVNMRVGPATSYAVEWMYTKPRLPVEIIQEYDNWRRIRDVDGTEGWINQALLSGKRTAIVAPWLQGKDRLLTMHAGQDANSRLVAQVEPGAVADISECNGSWCRLHFSERDGWMEQDLLWGIYPDETVKD